jgi:pimeloyl-ACP methyl ester carboxylesterase
MTVTTEPSSRSLSANGLSLHYLEWGRPGALPVVCVHGYTSSAQAFNALARHLQDRFHVLALDVRGHGESAWSPAGAYAYADQAGDVAAFVSRPSLRRIGVTGPNLALPGTDQRRGRGIRRERPRRYC